MRPYFSVIMPLYNHGDYVKDAIESVLTQSFGDFELIVCNDGSEDNSLDILLSMHDERIKVINKPNGGTVSALNACLLLSHGRMICWLSSDDVFAPDKLKTHYRLHSRRPEALISIAPYGYIRGEIFSSDMQVRPMAYDRLSQFSNGCYINGLSVCSHRQLFMQYGLFDNRYRYAHDAERWFQFFKKQQPFFIDGPSQSYTRVGTGTTPNAGPLGLIDMVRFLCYEINSHGLECLIPEDGLTRLTTSQIVEGVIFKVLNENSLFFQFHLNDLIIGAVASWLSRSGYFESVMNFVNEKKNEVNNNINEHLSQSLEKINSISTGVLAGPAMNFTEHLIGLKNIIAAPAQRDILERYIREGF